MGAGTQRWWVSEERLEARLADEHQRFEREKQRDAAVRALIKRHDEITHLYLPRGFDGPVIEGLADEVHYVERMPVEIVRHGTHHDIGSLCTLDNCPHAHRPAQAMVYVCAGCRLPLVQPNDPPLSAPGHVIGEDGGLYHPLCLKRAGLRERGLPPRSFRFCFGFGVVEFVARRDLESPMAVVVRTEDGSAIHTSLSLASMDAVEAMALNRFNGHVDGVECGPRLWSDLCADAHAMLRYSAASLPTSPGVDDRWAVPIDDLMRIGARDLSFTEPAPPFDKQHFTCARPGHSVTIAGVKFTAPEPPPLTAAEASRLDSEIAMGLSQAFRDAKPTVAGRIELAQRWLAEGRIDSEEYVKILEAPPNEPLCLKWVGYRFIDNNFEEKDMASLRDVTMTLEEFRARFRREPEAPGPDEHCCICNRKMPRVLGQDPTRFRRDGEPVLLVNDAGWMKVFFPWKWPDGATTLPEHSNVCPPCAERVAGYIAHLKKPALDDNDL